LEQTWFKRRHVFVGQPKSLVSASSEKSIPNVYFIHFVSQVKDDTLILLPRFLRRECIAYSKLLFSKDYLNDRHPRRPTGSNTPFTGAQNDLGVR
jgi:hypothetical protein